MLRTILQFRYITKLFSLLVPQMPEIFRSHGVYIEKIYIYKDYGSRYLNLFIYIITVTLIITACSVLYYLVELQKRAYTPSYRQAQQNA